ncbi:MAG: hypothetical protein ACOVOF_11070 [Chryseotalea sp.]|jgi:hypothetical protein
MKIIVLFFCAGIQLAYAQTEAKKKNTAGKSYNYFTEAGIEDNSFLIDEAFNQEKGINQYSAVFSIQPDELTLQYTLEMPVAHNRHQVSICIPYSISRSSQLAYHGVNDVSLAYQYSLTNKDDRFLLTPGFSVQIPTGDTQLNNLTGFTGINSFVAISKRVSNKLVLHGNARIGYHKKIKSVVQNTDDQQRILSFRSQTAGVSFVWLTAQRFNLLIENVFIRDVGKIQQGNYQTATHILNPGFRTSFHTKSTQFVFGTSCPTRFSTKSKPEMSLLFYVSIEAHHASK